MQILLTWLLVRDTVSPALYAQAVGITEDELRECADIVRRHYPEPPKLPTRRTR